MNAATIPLLYIVGEFVPETLMVPLSVVVRDELGQRSSQVARPKRNHPDGDAPPLAAMGRVLEASPFAVSP